MSSDKPIAWLGREKERRALELSVRHIEKIFETVTAMTEVVHLFSGDSEKYIEKTEEVLNRERAADEIEEKIMNELSKATYLPLSRERIIRLSITSERIADNARAAATKLRYLKPEDVDEDIKDLLYQLSHFVGDAVKLLKGTYSNLLEKEDIEATMGKTEQVEKMEEKIDYFRANKLIPKIVEWADKSHRPGTAILLIQIEENIEEVADQAENTADAVREIALGSA